ncbi:MAG: HAD family phosphatase [Verrucomicrobiae bacterium]|nr:HAD family phosphatase [Verrucomicrobiae bacterium]
MISTVIFDLDGLLTDTERLHYEAYRRALAEAGASLAQEEYAEHWIRRGQGIADFVRARALSLDPQKLRQRKSEHYLALLEAHLQFRPGALELLQRLHGRKRMALASSARSDAVQGVLDRLDFGRDFEVVATEADVARVKPHPDLFLHVANRMGVSPAECLVLEDAEKGVLAARAAGMKVIAVPQPLTRDNDFSQATRVLRSLEDVTLEMVESLG